MNKVKLKYIILILVIGLYIYQNYFQTNKLNEDIEKVIISKVIDGDTVYTNKGEKIRVIAINSPELGKNKEAFAIEAREFAKNTLENKIVYLERDISDKDRYGRKLRYIWLELPEEINKDNVEKYNYSSLLLKEGLARCYTFEPDVKYLKYFKNIEKQARIEKNGMWLNNSQGTTRGNNIEEE